MCSRSRGKLFPNGEKVRAGSFWLSVCLIEALVLFVTITCTAFPERLIVIETLASPCSGSLIPSCSLLIRSATYDVSAEEGSFVLSMRAVSVFKEVMGFTEACCPFEWETDVFDDRSR